MELRENDDSQRQKFPADKWEQNSVQTRGGSINFFSIFPKEEPKAVVQINHGMAEHAARYEEFATVLVKAGYAVYAHDHPGHGETKVHGAAQGYFGKKGGWDTVIETVSAINGLITIQHTDIPIITFGHSMGSIISFNFALRNPDRQSGLALWNSGVDTGALAAIYGMILKTERFFKGSDVPSQMAKKLTFETWNKQFAPNRTESDWLSGDEAEVDKYIADPLCGFDTTIGLWLDVLSGIYFAADDGNLAKLNKDMPVYLLAGDQDPCTNKGEAMANIEKRMNAVGMKDVTYALLKDTRHESLNELNRDETMVDFVTWLDGRFG